LRIAWQTQAVFGTSFAFSFVSTTERHEANMLKITRAHDNNLPPGLKLEGKLLEPWVEEVRQLFVGGGASSFPRLDLSGLTFVDKAGADLLLELLRRGVQFDSCSPYVAALLHWDRKQVR
jgi:hypothetical protein